jgi:ribosome-associated toxin RatA of RatAB toxin-antitoxin module
MAENTESSTVVAAPPQAVLDVIRDLPAYPRWAKDVKSVEVLTTDPQGRPARAKFVVDSGPIKDTYVLDYTWDIAPDGTGLVSWTLVEAKVVKRLDGSYRLAATPEGTEVTYRLTVDVVVPMLGMLKRKAEKVIVTTALTELTKRVQG